MLKTHHIKRDLLLLIAAGAAKAIVPMRDPRDCVVSLMQRFHRSFDTALRDVSSSLAHIDAIPSRGVLALRYEDRFAEKRETILKIAAFLGVDVGRRRRPVSTASCCEDPTMPEVVRRVDASHRGPCTNHITDTLRRTRRSTPSQRETGGALFHARETAQRWQVVPALRPLKWRSSHERMTRLMNVRPRSISSSGQCVFERMSIVADVAGGGGSSAELLHLDDDPWSSQYRVYGPSHERRDVA
jgi:hypothetical protein